MTYQNETTPDLRMKQDAGLILLPVMRATLCLLFLAYIAAGCAGSSVGPPFERAPRPPEHRARVYIYRADDRSSLASVRVTVDGLEVGRFRNNEYETLELPAGTHRLRASMRGFGLLAWGWNDHRFRLAPGKTTYLKISVRLTARSAPEARELEIAGRTSGTASENVFIAPESAEQALSDLIGTTRLVESATPEK